MELKKENTKIVTGATFPRAKTYTDELFRRNDSPSVLNSTVEGIKDPCRTFISSYNRLEADLRGIQSSFLSLMKDESYYLSSCLDENAYCKVKSVLEKDVPDILRTSIEQVLRHARDAFDEANTTFQYDPPSAHSKVESSVLVASPQDADELASSAISTPKLINELQMMVRDQGESVEAIQLLIKKTKNREVSDHLGEGRRQRTKITELEQGLQKQKHQGEVLKNVMLVLRKQTILGWDLKTAVSTALKRREEEHREEMHTMTSRLTVLKRVNDKLNAAISDARLYYSNKGQDRVVDTLEIAGTTSDNIEGGSSATYDTNVGVQNILTLNGSEDDDDAATSSAAPSPAIQYDAPSKLSINVNNHKPLFNSMSRPSTAPAQHILTIDKVDGAVVSAKPYRSTEGHPSPFLSSVSQTKEPVGNEKAYSIMCGEWRDNKYTWKTVGMYQENPVSRVCLETTRTRPGSVRGVRRGEGGSSSKEELFRPLTAPSPQPVLNIGHERRRESSRQQPTGRDGVKVPLHLQSLRVGARSANPKAVDHSGRYGEVVDQVRSKGDRDITKGIDTAFEEGGVLYIGKDVLKLTKKRIHHKGSHHTQSQAHS